MAEVNSRRENWNLPLVSLGFCGLPEVAWLKQWFKFSHEPSPAWHCVWPLRFYEASVTGRANYKRPESTNERWQAAGAMSHNPAVLPPLLLTKRDTAPLMVYQHALLSPMIPKGSEIEQERKERRGIKGGLDSGNANAVFHQPSVHLTFQSSFSGCKANASGWSLNRQILFRKQTWPLSADHFLLNNVPLMNNWRHPFPVSLFFASLLLLLHLYESCCLLLKGTTNKNSSKIFWHNEETGLIIALKLASFQSVFLCKNLAELRSPNVSIHTSWP